MKYGLNYLLTVSSGKLIVSNSFGYRREYKRFNSDSSRPSSQPRSSLSLNDLAGTSWSRSERSAGVVNYDETYEFLNNGLLKVSNRSYTSPFCMKQDKTTIYDGTYYYDTSKKLWYSRYVYATGFDGREYFILGVTTIENGKLIIDSRTGYDGLREEYERIYK